MFSQIFIHLLTRDNNRMGIVSVVANLTFIDGGSFGQKKKYQGAGEKNDTDDSMQREAKDIHRIQVI
jgi:hypothetical protein